MKDKNSIDELLSGFIDGELTVRQKTELQRLMTNDPSIEGRIKELEKCRQLVQSLPAAEAPPDILGNVRSAMEKSALLGSPEMHLVEQAGARHLIIRNVISVAAMVGLVMILGVVIYTVVSPDSFDGAAEQFVAVDNKPVLTEAVEPKADVIEIFTAELQLAALDPASAIGFVGKTLAGSDLLYRSKIGTETGEFVVECTKAEAIILVESIISHSSGFLSMDFTVRADEDIEIAGVGFEEIVGVLSQSSAEKYVKAAKYFASLDSIAEPVGDLDPQKAPMPVLTSEKEEIENRDIKVNLTISIVK